MHKVGLYIHWPFCQAKCPYCDFNSHVVAKVDQAAWRSAYSAEIARYRAEMPDVVVQSVFFGGGTPSLMEAETVTSVLNDVQRAWRTTNDVEITLEANPTSVEADRFAGYRAAGVNRVSLGVQALNDADLRRLGRLHSVAEARAAVDLARSTFDRLSFDLIYARQDQSLSDWETELDAALALAADHLSLYQLTIEDGTAFGARFAAGGLRGLPEEDLAADMFALTQEMTLAAGLPAYEISNHARPGAESRHNMIYWSGQDYIGFGPGAHGRVTIDGKRWATEAVSAPMKWLAGVRSGTQVEERSALTADDQIAERLMMGLRVLDGVPLSEIDVSSSKISSLEEIGVVKQTSERLRLTAAGRPLLNAILRELLA
ncbi:Oxygen-independent coproporphyrinogen-III oxidase 1 [Rhodobacteraceae bacterium THAF1]|nr:radical SAM family heme chaperone HemW [Palleronia sp. THAF1]QFU10163.1 Oxygen-independent coproporphyrinogen-III oxidase 1 [Palleronia sp. THAF1]VDC16932.1 Oxygen-independent coproporphyrinogen-III oxidase 1 [Rhodobacteraceae bacterium THAF1]